MFSYSEEGNIGEMEKEIVPKDGRNEKGNVDGQVTIMRKEGEMSKHLRYLRR